MVKIEKNLTYYFVNFVVIPAVDEMLYYLYNYNITHSLNFMKKINDVNYK